MLQFQQVLFAAAGQMSQVVKFFVNPGGNNITFADDSRRLGHKRTADGVDERRAVLKRLYEPFQGRICGADFFYRDYSVEAAAKLDNFAGSNLAGCRAGDYSLKVSKVADALSHVGQDIIGLYKGLDGIVAEVQLRDVHDG